MKRTVKELPKTGKYWAQKDTESTFPQKAAPKKKDRVAHPGIRAAKTEDQIDPAVKKGGDKDKISQPAGLKITQKAVKQPKAAAKHQGLPKMKKAAHPSSRRQKPSGRGSSYKRELT